MKAIVITQYGNAKVLQMQDVPTPTITASEVLIQVQAAGINRPDIAQRKGLYPAPAGAPQNIPGLEIAGNIVAVGQDVSRWKKGDAVCALVAGGGYAEFAVAHAGNCLPIPGSISIVDAASLPETFFTVWHNVFERGKLKSGENFLVHGGTSGIGITAIQLAKALGATVFTTAGSSQKCAACLNLGADRAINYHETDFEKAFEDVGVDVVLDMVGGDYVAKNIRLLREDGRLVFINAMKGAKVEVNFVEIMRKRLTITGSTLRSRSNQFKEELARQVELNAWPLIAAQKFTPVIHQVFAMQQASEAHQLMESSEHIGKIILQF